MIPVQWKMSSPIGSLYLVASENGLQKAYWDPVKEVPFLGSLQDANSAARILRQAVGEFAEYFEGRKKEFAVPLDAQGTEFQNQVWKELKKIPYGKTCSYSDVAKRLGKDKAVRAVGTANGRNPICIIVPCHRVIAADGGLGGYSGGLDIKRKLLALEQGLKQLEWTPESEDE